MPSPDRAHVSMPTGFSSGVIEGFYGRPWTQPERFELFRWMADWGLNTYMYAPKDDLKHRAIWREPYTPAEAAELSELLRGCQEKGLSFIHALSPGLDIRYTSASDHQRLKQRFEQMLALGCRNFCLLFDDIPDRMDPADLEQYGSLASAQAGLTNEMFRWIRTQQPECRLLFCPTPYCGRMAERKHGGENYLATLGRELAPEVEVFWTGPEIISPEITIEHIGSVQSVLRRKPLLWDNLHANDYDGRRFFCGPYAGRPRELLGGVAGVLVNPNCEFPLNHVPIHTLAEFVRGTGPWDSRAAYMAAMQDWREEFATVGGEVEEDDLILFGDCYYLPFEEGPRAIELCRQLEELFGQPPSAWGARREDCRRQVSRLREFCARLADLRNRPLFHALSRRVWELREELDLIERALAANIPGSDVFGPFHSDFHLPGTCRGGLVVRLQRLLMQRADGAFVSACRPPSAKTRAGAT